MSDIDSSLDYPQTGDVRRKRAQMPGSTTTSLSWWGRSSSRARIKTWLVLLVLICGSVVYVAPYLWVFSTELKTPAEAVKYPPVIIPKVLQWNNFVKAWTSVPFTRYTMNSLITSVVPAVAEVIVTSLVGYSFARLKWPGRDKVFAVVLLTMMLPHQVTMIPRFVLFSRLKWINTYWPLIIPHLGGSAFYVFLMRQFMVTLPIDLDEAAKIDGCSLFGIWWHIILPLCKPAMASVAIFAFLGGWSAFLYPMLYLNSTHMKTVTLGLTAFNVPDRGEEIHLRMAATFLVMIPPILVFFLAQKQFVQGIAMTGMKG